MSIPCNTSNSLHDGMPKPDADAEVIRSEDDVNAPISRSTICIVGVYVCVASSHEELNPWFTCGSFRKWWVGVCVCMLLGYMYGLWMLEGLKDGCGVVICLGG